MSDIPIFRDYTILDADCLANLYASDEIASILDTIPGQKAVVQYVRDKAMCYLYDDDGSTTFINVQLLIEKNLLQVVHFESEDESITAVNIAFLSNGRMRDDVAHSASIAIHRQWTLATDDRDSIVLLRQHQPRLHIVTTLDLLTYWIDSSQPSLEVVHDVLSKIQRRVGYKTYTGYHLEQWWQTHYRKNGMEG